MPETTKPDPPKARRKTALAVISAGLLAFVASACGASASANGVKACNLVHEALAVSAKSNSAASQQHALDLLRHALPYAAIAAGSDGNWQPLEATLSESNRVPLSHLRAALTAQCAPGNEGNVDGRGVFTQASIPPATSSPG